MVLTLYSTDYSPPCRAVLLTGKALGINFNIKEVNVRVGEQFNPSFIKINPQHTVPTLDDNGYILWDSHAINAYLVDTYGKNDSLYPKDIKQRCLVDQRLHFDTGSAFDHVKSIVRPMRLEGVKTIPEFKAKAVLDMYVIFELILNGEDWVAGKNVTIADLNLISSITSLDCLIPISPEKFPNITAWIKRCQALPYYEANQKGLDEFREFVQSLMS